MYIPASFSENDPESLLGIIESCGLGLLVTSGPQGIKANHLPLLVTLEGNQATLQGHLAKANPQWEDLATGEQALVVFSGPQAYISPGFYPSKRSNPSVIPTWNC